jgi:hypothetical protein
MKEFYVKHCFYFLTSLLAGYNGYAQLGPGGVGATDGSSSLKVWLRADKATYTDAGNTVAADGQKVLQWSDQSGSLLHGVQNSESYRPTYKASFSNGQPALSFLNNQLSVTLDISPSVTPEFTIFAVASHATATTGLSKLFGHDNGGYDRTIGFDTRGGTKRFTYFTGTSVGGFSNIPQANVPFLVTANYTANRFSGWVNGVQEVNNATVSNGSGSTSFSIGNLAGHTLSSNNEFWNGDIAEFILFNRSVTKAERLLVENYLAAKYGTALDPSSDLYTMDNSGYDFDVTGLGRADDGSEITVGKGTGLVSLAGSLNAAPAGVNAFLFIGHNNSNVNGVSSDVPAGMLKRMSREWRVSESAEVGAIALSFDMAGLRVASATDLRLLIDTDNDGAYTDETVAGGGVVDGAVQAGDTYTFSNVNLSNGTRFTIGSTSSVTLPLTLISFDAVRQGGTNQLTWRTASEQNTNYFEIENSTDGKQFKAIGRLTAAGNSTTPLGYSFVEHAPAGIVYYRLKMVDKDGKYTYSKVVSVSNEQQLTLPIRVSPNPVVNKAILKGLSGKAVLIKLITIKGEVVLEQKTNQQTVEIDMTSQPAGTYFIQVVTDGKVWTDRVIKN